MTPSGKMTPVVHPIEKLIRESNGDSLMIPIEKRIKQINYDLYLLNQMVKVPDLEGWIEMVQQLTEEKLTLLKQLQQETV